MPCDFTECPSNTDGKCDKLRLGNSKDGEKGHLKAQWFNSDILRDDQMLNENGVNKHDGKIAIGSFAAMAAGFIGMLSGSAIAATDKEKLLEDAKTMGEAISNSPIGFSILVGGFALLCAGTAFGAYKLNLTDENRSFIGPSETILKLANYLTQECKAKKRSEQ